MVKHRKQPTWVMLLAGDLPPGSVTIPLLGSIVADFEHPTGIKEPKGKRQDQGKQQDQAQQQDQGKEDAVKTVLQVTDSNVKQVLQDTSDAIARGRLSRLLQVQCATHGTSEEILNARTVVTRTLEDYDLVFNHMKANYEDAVRTMITQHGRRDNFTRKGYMVVGVKTCFAANLSQVRQLERRFELGLKVPVNEALESIGVPIPTNIDVGLDVGRDEMRKIMSEFTAEEERVFAIQYREITTHGAWKKALRSQRKKEIRMSDLAKAAHGRGLFRGQDESSSEDSDSDSNGGSSTKDSNALEIRGGIAEGFVGDNFYVMEL